jgi:hypothetical protein
MLSLCVLLVFILLVAKGQGALTAGLIPVLFIHM